MNNTEEYLRRNLLVASSVGVCAGLRKLHARLQTKKHVPKWIAKAVAFEIERAERLPKELAYHRDEIDLNEVKP